MKTLLRNTRILDGLGGLIDQGWLLMAGDRILALGSHRALTAEGALEAEETVDGAGATLLPGLIDAHVHLALDGSADPMTGLLHAADATAALHTARNAALTLRAGITSVRDMGSKNFIDLHVRDAVKGGLVPGPRIRCAGQMICMTGGHGWQMGCQADGPDGVRRAARIQIRAGVDLLKFMATGGVLSPGGRPGVPQLSLEELKAGIEEAHKVSLKAAAHSQGLEGTRNAVAAGIDSIEHGVSLDDAVIEEMLRQQVFLVPTLSAPANILRRGEAAGIPAEYVERSRRLIAEHAASLARAREAGVKIAMGTDAGTPFNRHGENAGELLLLVEHGFTPAEAIACATSAAAELLGLEAEVGSLAPGKKADLLMVEGNPLEDITLLAEPSCIRAVYKGGVRIPLP